MPIRHQSNHTLSANSDDRRRSGRRKTLPELKTDSHVDNKVNRWAMRWLRLSCDNTATILTCSIITCEPIGLCLYFYYTIATTTTTSCICPCPHAPVVILPYTSFYVIPDLRIEP